MERKVKIGGRVVTYTLVYSARRTTIELKILPGGHIELRAPTATHLAQADKIIKDNIDKIDALSRRLNSRRQSGKVYFRGEPYSLAITGGDTDSVNINGSVITVDTRGDGRELLKRFMVNEARRELRVALDKWAPTIGKPYYRVTVREQKTRWGSCSSKSNLNFNWKLIMAPAEALEYVVIHELCHLLHFNHSKQFWNEVGARMPDYEYWRKWLKQHGSDLTLD